MELMKKRWFALIIGVGLLMGFSNPLLNNWKIEDDYSIHFKGSGAKGTFSGLEGEINFDPQNLAASSMDVILDPATISTGNKTKDKHAKGKSWFDVEHYPQITFTSSEFLRADQGYVVKGTLFLHGIRKEISIPFDFEPNGTDGLFKGQLTVNRKDYNIKGNFFGFSVGKEFVVNINVPVTPIK